MCAYNYSTVQLAPGESLESTLWVSTDYSGKMFRLVLPVDVAKSDSKSGIRVKSDPIVLP